MASLIEISGTATSSPTSPSAAGNLSGRIDLGAKRTYDQVEGRSLTVDAPAGAPLVLGSGIARIRFAFIRSIDGASLRVVYDNGDGAGQVVRTSSVFYVDAPDAGDEMTALAVSGTGRIEYLVAGDAT